MSDAFTTEEQRRKWVEEQMVKDGTVAAPVKKICECIRCQMLHHFKVQVLPTCLDCGYRTCDKAADHRKPCSYADYLT